MAKHSYAVGLNPPLGQFVNHREPGPTPCQDNKHAGLLEHASDPTLMNTIEGLLHCLAKPFAEAGNFWTVEKLGKRDAAGRIVGKAVG